MALFVRHENKYQCTCHHGIDDFILTFDIDPYIDEFDKMKYVYNHENEVLSNFDVVIPVFHKNQSLALSLIGGTTDDANIIEKLQFIITITNIIAVAIENKRLFKQHLEQELFKNQMIFAMQIQNKLMPTEFIANQYIDLHGYYQPKHEVGGDYYDYITISEEEIFLTVADISGKGVAAALLMSNIQAILRTLLKRTQKISDILDEINQSINALMEGEKFASMFLAKYNMKTGTLNYLNAGHNPPLLINGEDKINLDANLSFLGSTEENPVVEEQEISIKNEAVLLMYTDGLTEIINSDEELFSMEYIEPIVERSKELNAFNINAELVKQAKSFAAKSDFLDDLTLFTCKFYRKND